MKKIPSLFVRDPQTHRLVNEVVPGCEWVLVGEGVATRKWDGTACMVRGGVLYKRYDAKSGKQPPANFEPAQDPDPNTGHWPGWVPVGQEPESRWAREAFALVPPELWNDGTYELIGPKVGGNPERQPDHLLVPHGQHFCDAPRTFDALARWLADYAGEGVVWHHQDGRMAKAKRRDFGHPWPIPVTATAQTTA